jgi:solute carrier family 25 S-adenosylmethionine transporter 26
MEIESLDTSRMFKAFALLLFILAVGECTTPIGLLPKAKRIDKADNNNVDSAGESGNEHVERRTLLDGTKDGIASACASAVAKFILQPLDTIKTVQQANAAVKLNAFEAGNYVLKSRGVLGLWSGVGISIAGSTPSTAVYFGVYSSVKRDLLARFPPSMKMLAVALAAAFGNMFASFIRVPLEVIKQRMQAGQYTSTLEAITSCIRDEGILGVWGRGKFTAQLARDIPYAVITLMSYEILQIVVTRALRAHASRAVSSSKTKTQIAMRPLSQWGSRNVMHFANVLYTSFSEDRFRNAICGALAGGFGSLMTNPMDLMKTRMMTSSKYNSVVVAALSILKNEGIMTFFVGVGPRLLHKIPANGLFFLCYESFRSIMGVKSTAKE